MSSKATLADLLLPEETKELTDYKAATKGLATYLADGHVLTIRKLKTKHLAKLLKQFPEPEKDTIGFAQALVVQGVKDPELTMEMVGELDTKDTTGISTEITKFSGFTEEELEKAKAYPTSGKAGPSGT